MAPGPQHVSQRVIQANHPAINPDSTFYNPFW